MDLELCYEYMSTPGASTLKFIGSIKLTTAEVDPMTVIFGNVKNTLISNNVNSRFPCVPNYSIQLKRQYSILPFPMANIIPATERRWRGWSADSDKPVSTSVNGDPIIGVIPVEPVSRRRRNPP